MGPSMDERVKELVDGVRDRFATLCLEVDRDTARDFRAVNNALETLRVLASCSGPVGFVVNQEPEKVEAQPDPYRAYLVAFINAASRSGTGWIDEGEPIECLQAAALGAMQAETSSGPLWRREQLAAMLASMRDGK